MGAPFSGRKAHSALRHLVFVYPSVYTKIKGEKTHVIKQQRYQGIL
jgi:hypothetical protein